MPHPAQVRKLFPLFALILGIGLGALRLSAADASIQVMSFYLAQTEAAHLSFVREANTWFARAAATNHFIYNATSNWDDLNDAALAKCQVVVFLDARPPSSAQRAAFKHYMEAGGGWMGIHFAGFAFTPSEFPQIGIGITTNFWEAALGLAIPGSRPRPFCAWKTKTIHQPRGCPKHFTRRRTNGTNGAMTCARTRTLTSCCPLIRPVSPWGRARKRMRFGTQVIIRSSGPTSVIGWSISTWATMISTEKNNSPRPLKVSHRTGSSLTPCFGWAVDKNRIPTRVRLPFASD